MLGGLIEFFGLLISWFMIWEAKDNDRRQQKKQELEKEKQKLEQEQQEKEKRQKEIEELKKIVTHYCPNCGVLISNRTKSFSYCTICGTKLENAMEEVTLKSVLFKAVKLDESKRAQAMESYSEALKYFDTGNYQQFIIKNNYAVELGYSPAIYALGFAHYHTKGVSKNNVFAQKYMEEAAVIGYALAYRYITELCVSGEFRWSKIVANAEEGYFRAAIRGDLKSINHILSKMGGIRKITEIKDAHVNSPTIENQRLWWAIRAAEKGSSNGIKLIYETCDKILLNLSKFEGEKEVDKLITQYKSLVNYWKDKELHVKYPDEDCYNAYIAEQNGEYEKALALYEKAAERNDQKAIEGYRRLSGDPNYKKNKKAVAQNKVVTLEQALSTVTHYCPKCGFLIYDKENQIEKCPLCGNDLLEEKVDEEFSTMELFPKPYGSEISRDEIRYYVRYPELSDAEKRGDYKYISNYAEEHPEDGVAQYVLACVYEKKGEEKKCIEQLKLAIELNSSEAAYKLGKFYYEGHGGAEKDNVLAQKYMEIAAALGCGKAYDFIMQRCMSREFRWSQTVKNEEDGLFKAAVKGISTAGFKICQTYSGNRKTDISMDMKNRIPFEMTSKLWWMIRMARQGELDAVTYIKEYCTSLMKILSQYKDSNEASDLHKEYDQILKYWTEKELILKYPNPFCYQGVLAEQNGDFVMAREYYKMAAEKDNDEQAIKAFRRLTGNRRFMLRTVPKEGRDYKPNYEKAMSFLQNGEYQTCRIWARNTLEAYIKNLFFEKQEDMPSRDDLNTLLKTVRERQLVDAKIYKAMDFIRYSGNNAVHGSVKEDEDLAKRVMDALTRIIENE